MEKAIEILISILVSVFVSSISIFIVMWIASKTFLKDIFRD